MLVERQIPLELSALRGSHCRVLLGLLRYADKDGVCWPSLRTLASAVPMALRGVRRAIEEMEGLGYLVIERGCGRSVSRYRIAARLLRATGRPVKPPTEVVISGAPDSEATEVDGRQLEFDFAAPRSVRILARSERIARTEGLAKKAEQDSIKEGGELRRFAPLESNLVAGASASDDSFDRSEGPPRGPLPSDQRLEAPANPVRYNHEVELRKWRALLAQLNQWASRSACEAEQWPCWEAISEAGETRAETPKEVRSRLEVFFRRAGIGAQKPGRAAA